MIIESFQGGILELSKEPGSNKIYASKKKRERKAGEKEKGGGEQDVKPTLGLRRNSPRGPGEGSASVAGKKKNHQGGKGIIFPMTQRGVRDPNPESQGARRG